MEVYKNLLKNIYSKNNINQIKNEVDSYISLHFLFDYDTTIYYKNLYKN